MKGKGCLQKQFSDFVNMGVDKVPENLEQPESKKAAKKEAKKAEKAAKKAEHKASNPQAQTEVQEGNFYCFIYFSINNLHTIFYR